MSLQVIGGVQRFHAIRIINQKGKKIDDRRCVVYGCGLTQAAALTLAQRHNETNQLQRATSFSEIAGTCRRLIFSEFGDELDDTMDGSMPDVPRYNSQNYRDFKSKCLSILVNTQTVSGASMLHDYLGWPYSQNSPLDTCLHEVNYYCTMIREVMYT